MVAVTASAEASSWFYNKSTDTKEAEAWTVHLSSTCTNAAELTDAATRQKFEGLTNATIHACNLASQSEALCLVC